MLSVVDQSALVTLIARLTDLGIRIEQITATRSGTANAPGPAGPT
ncbi:MAG TPA: hypothetical protein VFB94_24855 [Acidimicrobiales bacterium]|nr:hypothetical protein [Acidimicrobiales bacterium]